MKTISIQLNKEVAELTDQIMKSKNIASYSQLIEIALHNLKEQEAIEEVKKAEEDIKQGRVYEGDILELSKKFE